RAGCRKVRGGGGLRDPNPALRRTINKDTASTFYGRFGEIPARSGKIQNKLRKGSPERNMELLGPCGLFDSCGLHGQRHSSACRHHCRDRLCDDRAESAGLPHAGSKPRAQAADRTASFEPRKAYKIFYAARTRSGRMAEMAQGKNSGQL